MLLIDRIKSVASLWAASVLHIYATLYMLMKRISKYSLDFIQYQQNTREDIVNSSIRYTFKVSLHWKEVDIMELRHIRYFLALAEELNFSRAAEKLHIAQPHLSRQIQELEEQVGASLFYRTKRQVELTNAGKVFLNHAYNILDQVERAYINTRLSSTGLEGEITIGFNGVFQDLISTLKKYRAEFPNVSIKLMNMTSTEQMKALNEKRIDIGTITVPINHENIKSVPLTTIPFKVALPENHPLASKKSIHLHALKEETFIITSKSAGPTYYETFYRAFEQANFIPNTSIQAHDLNTVMALIRAEMGVSIVPTIANAYDGIVMRKLADVELTISPSIAWRKDNHSIILKNFLEFFFENKDKILNFAQNKRN